MGIEELQKLKKELILKSGEIKDRYIKMLGQIELINAMIEAKDRKDKNE